MGFDGAHLDVGNANNHPMFDQEAGTFFFSQKMHTHIDLGFRFSVLLMCYVAHVNMVLNEKLSMKNSQLKILKQNISSNKGKNPIFDFFQNRAWPHVVYLEQIKKCVSAFSENRKKS